MKKNMSTIILVFILIIGLSLLLYPSVSDYWNSFHQSRAIANYDAAVSQLDETDYEKIFAQADSYNHRLSELRFPMMYYDQVDGYEDALNISNTGIMGYINISKIGVELPIYHGTSEGTLQVAVGHLEGTSLPTGGNGTHCVLSSHRGLPSAELFTNLDKMEEGDTFSITVLNRMMTYEIESIVIVEPEEVDSLSIQEGRDLCTLVTCTPYGVNSHRMLLTGHRVENPEDVQVVHVAVEAIQLKPLLVAPIVAIPMILLLLIVFMLPKRKKKGKDIQKEELEIK